MPVRRVALLYADHPSGHSGAAAAIEEQLRITSLELEPVHLDLNSEFHPFLGPLVGRAYLELVQRAPALWAALYDNETVAQTLREIKDALSLHHRLKLRERLAALSPACVVCTHALPCATLAIEKEQRRLNIPLVAVLTDLGAHSYWVCPQVDLYLVPTAEVERELRRRGVDAAVRVTGIPVSPRFRTPPGKEEARRSLGLDPGRATLLVSGGSKGLGPIRNVARRLRADLPQAQLLVLCGSNAKLFRWFSARRLEGDSLLKALPYTDEMPRCLAAADLMIGKAGGVSVSEALAAGIPMILLSPLPGQEDRNAAFLVGRGAAARVDDLAAISDAVRAVLVSGGRLDAMRRAARALGRAGSALDACNAIRNLL